MAELLRPAPRRTVLLAAVALVLVCLITGALAATLRGPLPAGEEAASLAPAAAEGDAPRPDQPAPAPGAAPHRRVEAERIVVGRGGFFPAEITRPQGPFLLSIDNRSGVEDLDLSLDREAGPGLRETRLSRERKKARDLLDLPPGRYVLRAAAHPDWRCLITITAR